MRASTKAILDKISSIKKNKKGLNQYEYIKELELIIDEIENNLHFTRVSTAINNTGNENQLCKIIQYIPIPIMIGRLNGKIIQINSKFEDIFGYRIEEIVDAETWFKLAYPD